MKKNQIFIIGLLNIYNTYSFAQENMSVIPPIQGYEKNNTDINELPPYLKNIIPEISPETKIETNQKIENSISDAFRKEDKIDENIHPKISKNPENDFTSFVEKKNYLKNEKSEPSLWQGASLVIAFISFLGIAAFLMTRIKRKGIFKNPKNEKMLNIISTLSITPKRQVMILQIRDKEIVISNTENGINFLTEISSNNPVVREIALEKKPIQIGNLIKTHSTQENIKQNKNAEEEKTTVTEKKSEILIKALKRMERTPEAEKPVKEEKIKKESEENNPIFPKYFSNIFENEAKKDVKKKEESDSVENVTNLIREKLRSMKPLN